MEGLLLRRRRSQRRFSKGVAELGDGYYESARCSDDSRTNVLECFLRSVVVDFSMV